MKLSTKYYISFLLIFVCLLAVTDSFFIQAIALFMSFASLLFGRFAEEERHRTDFTKLEKAKGQWEQ